MKPAIYPSGGKEEERSLSNDVPQRGSGSQPQYIVLLLGNLNLNFMGFFFFLSLSNGQATIFNVFFSFLSAITPVDCE